MRGGARPDRLLRRLRRADAIPNDIWASRDGKRWFELEKPASPPWRAVDPDDAKYDFDALVVRDGPFGLFPSILTFGGDRERFELPADVNATRVDNDVWRLGLTLAPAPLTGARPAGPRQRSGGQTRGIASRLLRR